MAENPETFPAGPWEWRGFGAPLMLTTSHGGAKVVLAAGLEPDGRTHLMARDADGVLEPVTADHPVARLLEATPDLLEACELVDGELSDPRMIQVAIPRLRKVLRAAIAKATGTSDA